MTPRGDVDPRTRFRRLLSFLAAGALFLAAGCTREPPALPPPIPISAEEAAAILSELDRDAENVRRYQGIVRIRGRGPEGSFDARLVVIFERPERLRVELLGAFGGTRWSAVADPDGITAYFPGDEQYVREPDVTDVVSRLLGLAIDEGDIMALLSGAGLRISDGAAVEGARRGALTEIRLDDGGRLLVDETGQVTLAETSRYRASYGTSWKRTGRQIPPEIRIENDRLRATIHAEEVDVNVALDPEAFELEIPPDAERLVPADVEGQAVFVRTGGPARERERERD